MKSARTKKKSLIVRLGIFAFAAYVVVSLVSLQVEIGIRQSQLAELDAQIESQRLANKETERLISLGEDKDFLSRIAREKLDMGFSDEHVYRDASGS